MISGGNEDGGTAKGVGTSAVGNPIHFHSLKQSEGCDADLMGLIPEFKFRAESVDEQGRVDQGQLKVQVSDKLEVAST